MKHYKALITMTILTLNILCFAQFAGGTGTYEDPYLIETAEQLNQVRNYMTSSFRQIADIDLGVPPWNEGTGWEPIGYYLWTNPSLSFRGNYDGGGYRVTNMYINNWDRHYLGLFGSTIDSELKNIHVINFVISGTSPIGGLVANVYSSNILDCTAEGRIVGDATLGLLIGFYGGERHKIENCHVKGEIMNAADGSDIGGFIGYCRAKSIINCSADVKIFSSSSFVGGFIGFYQAPQLIKDCYAKVDITTENGGGWIGGFIGAASLGQEGPAYIKNCFVEGTMDLSPRSDRIAFGGFFGQVDGKEHNIASIINCYSKVDVKGGNDKVGGFAGRIYHHVLFENSYSAGFVSGNTNVGGFVGYIEFPETVSAKNSYWDVERSGQASSAAGEGRSTSEMTYPYADNSYVDWDFQVAWSRDTDNINEGYPYLNWANMPVEGVVVQNLIREQGMFFEETRQVDVSDVFVDVNGNDVTVTLEGVTDPSVLSAQMLDGNSLSLTAHSTLGSTHIILKGTAGDHYALYEFKVNVYEPEYYKIEDFESGGFLSLPWVHSGDADWFIDTDNVYEGVYSARSGVIDHDQRTELSVEMEYPSPGRISFYAKISSETTRDYMFFFINGEKMLSLSGESDWNYHVFPVDTGKHTFSWAYQKNGWSSWFSDCAWVDYIVFEGGTPSGIEEYAALPVKHKLYQNYPNPFNPVTQIRFALAKTSDVKLSVYNISGQRVAELASGVKNAGHHAVDFDGSRLNSGIYYYTLEVDGKAITKRMLMIK